MTATHSVTPGPQLIRARAFDPWRHGEPSVAEVMSDPLVHLLMQRDGLVVDEVWPQILEVQSRLGRRLLRSMAVAAWAAEFDSACRVKW